MNFKILIPLCAVAALLTSCGHHDESSTDAEPAAQPAAEPATSTPGVGDTSTTPGGNAGDASTSAPSEPPK